MWTLDFTNGNTYSVSSKSLPNYVRAVRRAF